MPMYTGMGDPTGGSAGLDTRDSWNAIAAPTPTSAWTCQEASGNLIDLFGFNYIGNTVQASHSNSIFSNSDAPAGWTIL